MLRLCVFFTWPIGNANDGLICPRIDRYTASTPTTAINTTNLPLRSKPGPSPSISMLTNPSATNPTLDSPQQQPTSTLPSAVSLPQYVLPAAAAAATHHTSYSPNDMFVPTSGIKHTSSAPPSWAGDVAAVGQLHIHGAEPRIFPGVLTRSARKGSVRTAAAGGVVMPQKDGSDAPPKARGDSEAKSTVVDYAPVEDGGH